MPASYSSPGVYIVEVPIRPNIVPAAGAASLAVFAPFEFGPNVRAVRISNWNEFVETFVAKYDANGNLRWQEFFLDSAGDIKKVAYAIYLYFLNGGGAVYVYRNVTGNYGTATVKTTVGSTNYFLTATAKFVGNWSNNFKVSISQDTTTPREGTGPYFKIQIKYQDSIVTTAIILEEFNGISFADEDTNKPYHYRKITSKFVNFSIPSPAPDPSTTPSEVSLSGGSSSVVSDLNTIRSAFADTNEILIFAVPQWENRTSSTDYSKFKDLISNLSYALAIASFDITDLSTINVSTARSEKVVFYYPYVRVTNPYTQTPEAVSPSGAIAGKYVFTDNQFNPGRVPAGIAIGALNGVQSLAYWSGSSYAFIDKLSQSTIDRYYPQHFNPIVLRPDGYYLWGARTSSFNPEWTYINKRRLLYFVEKSIKDALAWVNFENNTPATRFAVRSQIDLFLYRLTVEGYFASTNPAEAYYVICDETNNPPDLVAQGYLIVDVGIAPAKPAEFVVLRFTEKTAGSQ